jgi:hypothetical protein
MQEAPVVEAAEQTALPLVITAPPVNPVTAAAIPRAEEPEARMALRLAALTMGVQELALAMRTPLEGTAEEGMVP